jgi:hypothetical protein
MHLVETVILIEMKIRFSLLREKFLKISQILR